MNAAELAVRSQATPRPASAIANDFASGASKLSAMAGDWRQAQFKPGDISAADAILRGMSHCLAELRARGDDQ